MEKEKKPLVLSLDAGGTNFVFSAIKGFEPVGIPWRCPAVTDDLDRCLETICNGFWKVCDGVGEKPVAISFAFPGPADYINGVIGDIPNFKAFRGGIALGPYLERRFGIPVFINNDGNLFALGESANGRLQDVNRELKAKGNSHIYHNMVGVTLGTGFGCGVIVNGKLLLGDNGAGGDTWLMHNHLHEGMIAEESVSARGVVRMYEKTVGLKNTMLSPKNIYDIAKGSYEGDAGAAKESFKELGIVLGRCLTYVLDIVDGPVVIGGGLAGAYNLFIPYLMQELRMQVETFKGDKFSVVQSKVYNWENAIDREKFLSQIQFEVTIPQATKTVPYMANKSICICRSASGASKSIMIGAYAFAMDKINNYNQ